MGQQEESPLIALAHKVYDSLDKWGATKDVEKSTPHSKAIDEMNKKLNDKSVRDANDSFRKGTTMKSSPATGGKPKSKKTRKRAPAKR